MSEREGGGGFRVLWMIRVCGECLKSGGICSYF